MPVLFLKSCFSACYCARIDVTKMYMDQVPVYNSNNMRKLMLKAEAKEQVIMQ